jgi:hypothetical protein
MAFYSNNEKLEELEIVKKTVALIVDFKEKFKNDDLGMTQDEFKTFMNNMFSTFIEKYNALYKMVLENDNIDMLYTMIEQIVNICNGNVTLDDARNKMGNDLADKYIYTKIDKPKKN